MNITEINELIQREKVREIILQFADIDGVLHSLWVPSSHFEQVAKEGIHTDGSSLSGVVNVSKSDLKLMPDIDSFTVLPLDLFPTRVAWVICDIFLPESEQPFELDPRNILRNAIEDARETLGPSVTYYAASEIEFFLLHETDDGRVELIDEGGYLATPPADRGADLRLEMAETLRKMGITIEKHHHEVPHGKSEFNLEYTNALRMADTVYLVKFIVKLLASRYGLIASFMPKPFHGEYGAGLHTHVSLIDDEKGENILHDPNDSQALSKVAFNFLAGILSHAKALAGITNPSVNSYKRLVPGWEAPVNISWARYNRSVLVRIPPGKGMGTRFEYRPTDGSCNFYLAYASILLAGLDGIKGNLEPPEPVEEDIYKMSEDERVKRGIATLPGNLWDALKELSTDICLQDGLGNRFFKKYLELKTKEWREFSTAVHEWERKRYLDV